MGILLSTGPRAEGLDISGAALINRGWVEAGVTELDTASGQLTGVRRIMACESEAEVILLLQDPSYVADFVKEYSGQGPASGASGFENMEIIDIGDDSSLLPYLGKTLGVIANETGQHVVEVLTELGWKSNLQLQLKSAPFSATDPALPVSLLRCPAIAAGVSDGGAHTRAFSNGHYGTELLVWLVREEKLMTVEEMHHQLAMKVARTIQLDDRGGLLPGFAADILIYDLDALYLDFGRYEIVHDMPLASWRRKPKAGGYDRILVNGVTTHIKDKPTGATPGHVLRVTSNLAVQRQVAAE